MTTQIKKSPVVDNFFGTLVADPYRWLEDPNSPESKQWAEKQIAKTNQYLSEIPERDQYKARLTEYYNYQKVFLPERHGDSYYFLKNDGLQNQPVLYRSQDLADFSGEVVLDPNTLNDKGTTALTSFSFDKSAKYMAYATSVDGSDRQEIRVRDLITGVDTRDHIQWCKFTPIVWNEKSEGFYYTRFPVPGTVEPEDESNFNKVYWHALGTDQSEDNLIYEALEDKELTFYPHLSDNNRYLTLMVARGTNSENQFYYKDLQSDGEVVRLLVDEDAAYHFIGNDETIFYFFTTFNAPKGKVIAIDINTPEKENWKTLIPEQEDVLESIKIVGERFIAGYLHDAHHQVKIYGLDGTFMADIDLPTLGTVDSFTGKRKSSELFFGFTSFLYPYSVYRYSFEDSTTEQVFGPEMDFNPDQFETTQVFYPSKDSTKVPMFLTHKKGLKLIGNIPVLLTAYGGFNISRTPSFSPFHRLWIEDGGVLALANLRGGGEYGEAWHRAGMLDKKQNVFDDFIAAGEYLVKEAYTSPSKLSIIGGSNGGLLVGAVMLQSPSLYGAVICQVPVTDMLRYHKFTVGRYWVGEYGNAEADRETFTNLMSYSPLHNVKPNVSYPPILVTTADTDDRVVPSHAKKFTATLQESHFDDKPVLIRIEMNAGHGAGKPTSKLIDEQADILAFLYKNLKLGE